MLEYELASYQHTNKEGSAFETCYLTVTTRKVNALLPTDDERAYANIKRKLGLLLNDELGKLNNKEY